MIVNLLKIFKIFHAICTAEEGCRMDEPQCYGSNNATQVNKINGPGNSLIGNTFLKVLKSMKRTKQQQQNKITNFTLILIMLVDPQVR